MYNIKYRNTLVNIVYMNFKLQGLNTKHENSYKYPHPRNVFRISVQKEVSSSLLSKTTKIKTPKVIILQISENKVPV